MNQELITHWSIEAHKYALKYSQDTHSKVGSALISSNGVLYGTNRLPMPIRECYQPYMIQRPHKYDWITHAERDVIYEAVNAGYDLSECTLIVTKYPCHECLRTMGQLGVKKFFSPKGDPNHPTWGEAFKISKLMIDYYKINHTEINKPSI